MSEQYVTANGIRLAYEEFGDPNDPAILLIMGLGTQMIAWPEPFCRELAEQGYRVIRFDNRDIGLSQKMEGAQVPHMLKLAAYPRLGLPLKVPYTLYHMTKDAVGLLNALDIGAAHVVGASMGGMIGQLMAGIYPFRVLSLTSIMSTSGCSSVPGADPKIQLHMMRRPANADRETLEDYAMRTWRMIGSPGYPPTDEALLAKIRASYERSFYPQGHRRHLAAVLASGDRVKVLKKIIAPTLVIHGTHDPLVPVEGGIDTARHVADARLELIEGMGHDLPAPLLGRFAALIGEHADNALKVAGPGARKPDLVSS